MRHSTNYTETSTKDHEGRFQNAFDNAKTVDKERTAAKTCQHRIAVT